MWSGTVISNLNESALWEVVIISELIDLMLPQIALDLINSRH